MEAARAGGAVALEHYRRGFSVSLKPDRSPVTEADREAERAIVGLLRARCPDHGALGEELGESGPRDRRFIVDPIDGTRNFVRRIPTWAVLIGLEEGGEVTAGVVYQPATGVLHTARRGQGAWRDGERIRVSPVDALERALVVHSSVNYLRRSPYWEGFLHLADRTQVQHGFGDFSAYLWVAEGQGEMPSAPSTISFTSLLRSWAAGKRASEENSSTRERTVSTAPAMVSAHPWITAREASSGAAPSLPATACCTTRRWPPCATGGEAAGHELFR